MSLSHFERAKLLFCLDNTKLELLGNLGLHTIYYVYCSISKFWVLHDLCLLIFKRSLILDLINRSSLHVRVFLAYMVSWAIRVSLRPLCVVHASVRGQQLDGQHSRSTFSAQSLWLWNLLRIFGSMKSRPFKIWVIWVQKLGH